MDTQIMLTIQTVLLMQLFSHCPENYVTSHHVTSTDQHSQQLTFHLKVAKLALWYQYSHILRAPEAPEAPEVLVVSKAWEAPEAWEAPAHSITMA